MAGRFKIPFEEYLEEKIFSLYPKTI